ncbi:hypothetical protein [Arthrobacter sp. ISL-85]|nr:hypothetical protein [Arthrobacter sp. ISL-85]
MLAGIPAEVLDYQVNGKSAIQWPLTADPKDRATLYRYLAKS